MNNKSRYFVSDYGSRPVYHIYTFDSGMVSVWQWLNHRSSWRHVRSFDNFPDALTFARNIAPGVIEEMDKQSVNNIHPKCIH